MSEPRAYGITLDFYEDLADLVRQSKGKYANPPQPQGGGAPRQMVPPLQRLAIWDNVPTGWSNGVAYWLAKPVTNWQPGDQFATPPVPFGGWQTIDKPLTGLGAIVVVFDDTGSNVFGFGQQVYAVRRGSVKFNTSGDFRSTEYNPIAPVRQVQFEMFSALPGGDAFLRITGPAGGGSGSVLFYNARPQIWNGGGFGDACPEDTAYLFQKAGAPIGTDPSSNIYSATPMRATIATVADLNPRGIWCTAERDC